MPLNVDSIKRHCDHDPDREPDKQFSTDPMTPASSTYVLSNLLYLLTQVCIVLLVSALLLINLLLLLLIFLLLAYSRPLDVDLCVVSIVFDPPHSNRYILLAANGGRRSTLQRGCLASCRTTS